MLRSLLLATAAAVSPSASAGSDLMAGKPFLTSELIFPLEHWHNHGSCIVEAPNGALIVCWFHGSGERTADDVKIEGARLRKGAKTWSPRFTMADTPGLEFGTAVSNFTSHAEATLDKSARGAERGQRAEAWLASLRTQAADKLTRRLGWFTRAHPFVLEDRRLIVPLYSDGFSFSLMNISDDEGKSWKWKNYLELAPEDGGRFHYPSILQAKDGTLHASYSYHLGKNAETDAEGRPRSKSIRHAHLNEAWVMAGNPTQASMPYRDVGEAVRFFQCESGAIQRGEPDAAAHGAEVDGEVTGRHEAGRWNRE